MVNLCASPHLSHSQNPSCRQTTTLLPWCRYFHLDHLPTVVPKAIMIHRTATADMASFAFAPTCNNVLHGNHYGGHRRRIGVALPPNASPQFTESSSALRATPVPTDAVDVLSTNDIVVGTILAFVLAFGYSFLNGQSSSSNFISWRSQVLDESKDMSSSSESSLSLPANATDAESNVFNEWKDMSRRDNYVLYNTKIRNDQGKREQRGTDTSNGRKEQKWVVIALLVLFVPIFSAEFFFALSRQFMCGGNVFTQPEWAQLLCSPAQ